MSGQERHRALRCLLHASLNRMFKLSNMLQWWRNVNKKGIYRMRRNGAMIAVLAGMLLTLSACGNSTSNASATPKQHHSSNPTLPHASDPGNGAQTASGHSDQPDQSKPSKPGNQEWVHARTNAVIQATLKMKSRKPDTSVDYESKTMTQSGKKAGFEIVPASGHQEDFKEGLIKEVIGNGVNNVTLFEYRFRHHQLSLIDTSKCILRISILGGRR